VTRQLTASPGNHVACQLNASPGNHVTRQLNASPGAYEVNGLKEFPEVEHSALVLIQDPAKALKLIGKLL
jgi:hypothetical protein